MLLARATSSNEQWVKRDAMARKVSPGWTVYVEEEVVSWVDEEEDQRKLPLSLERMEERLIVLDW